MADTAVATPTDERPNTVKIQDAGPSRKKISIEIPAETVAEQLGTSLDTLMVEAEIPGFRKGRAPKRLIEKKFGSAVRREAKNQLVATAYQKAVEEHKLRVLGDPISEGLEKIELQDGKPLAFEVEVEVLPEFELPALEGIAIKKPIIEVTDQMIEDELDKLRLHEGRLEERETPEPGDYLTGHGVMTVKGADKPLVDINDAVVQVPPPEKEGKGMILGIMVEDFAKQIGLPKAGETATIKVKGPESHENETIRGADLTITFEVARVDRIIRAADDDLVAAYGFEAIGQLKDAIKERMGQRIAVEQQSAMRTQVARHLVANITMELPERITAVQAERILARRRFDLMHRGVGGEQIEEHIAELRAASSDAAVRDLKLSFILERASEALDVKVTEGEMNSRIVQMAMANNMRPDKLRSELIQRNQVGQIFQQLRDHKALDAIIAKAAVTEVSVEEFNKEMAAEGGDAKPAPKKSTKKAAAAEADKAESEEPAAEKKPRSKKK